MKYWKETTKQRTVFIVVMFVVIIGIKAFEYWELIKEL